MALYKLTVAGEAPLWPDLARFNGMTRTKRHAAFIALWHAMRNAFEGDGALDTQRAHAAMRWLSSVELHGVRKPGRIATHETARFTFSVERVA